LISLFPEPLLTRRRFSQLLASFTVSGAAQARKANEAAPPFEAVLESDVRVRMRDGLSLATDVYRSWIPMAATSSPVAWHGSIAT
jgi:predicted acyl esterase